MEAKPVINFSSTVAPGETKTISHAFDSSGYVTHLHARAYPGEDRSVKRYVRLWQGGKDEGVPIPLVRSPEGADDYLAGQDETWQLDMRRRVEQDDELEVKFVNEGDYEYPCSTVMTVDHDASLFAKLGDLL